MGYTRIEDSDKGSRAYVNGVSLEGHRCQGLGTIEGVRTSGFGNSEVYVKLDSTGKVERFRQEDVSGTGS